MHQIIIAYFGISCIKIIMVFLVDQASGNASLPLRLFKHDRNPRIKQLRPLLMCYNEWTDTVAYGVIDQKEREEIETEREYTRTIAIMEADTPNQFNGCLSGITIIITPATSTNFQFRRNESNDHVRWDVYPINNKHDCTVPAMCQFNWRALPVNRREDNKPPCLYVRIKS